MSDNRLPTSLWVDAEMRRLQTAGVYVTLLNKGNAASGTMILKLRRRFGISHVYTQARDGAGRLCWLPALNGEAVADEAADAYIRSALRFDPDAWALEIETEAEEIPIGLPE